MALRKTTVQLRNGLKRVREDFKKQGLSRNFAASSLRRQRNALGKKGARIAVAGYGHINPYK